MSSGQILDEALTRIHRTGPEFEGWLSNHAPMVVEAMVRRGHADTVHRWLDDYMARLDEVPPSRERIDEPGWREALGDPGRLGDWLDHFARTLAERPWREVLATWWPRLLPGIAASATHGVIRTGHAVHALRDTQTSQRVAELAQALGYWAARFQPLAGQPLAGEPVVGQPLAGQPIAGQPNTAGQAPQPSGDLGAGAALAGLVPVPHQTGGIRDRLRQLPTLPGWAESVARLRPVSDASQVAPALADIVAAATTAYAEYERSGNIMLIHAATAPNAVLRSLPALPDDQWLPSLYAAWVATAAVFSSYAQPAIAPVPPPPELPEHLHPDEIVARAVAHGDEHVIKLADTAAEVYARTQDVRALASADYAIVHVQR